METSSAPTVLRPQLQGPPALQASSSSKALALYFILFFFFSLSRCASLMPHPTAGGPVPLGGPVPGHPGAAVRRGAGGAAPAPGTQPPPAPRLGQHGGQKVSPWQPCRMTGLFSPPFGGGRVGGGWKCRRLRQPLHARHAGPASTWGCLDVAFVGVKATFWGCSLRVKWLGAASQPCLTTTHHGKPCWWLRTLF